MALIRSQKPGSYRISRWRHFQAELPEFPFGPQGVFFPGKRGNGVDGEDTLWRACCCFFWSFRSKKKIAPLTWIMFEGFLVFLLNEEQEESENEIFGSY